MSIKDFNDDQEVIHEGRGPKLDAPKAPLKYQVSEKLRARLEKEDIGHKVVEAWNTGNSNRAERIERRRKLLMMLDEFMEPIYNKPQEWMSNLHIPVAFLVSKVFHARMYQAVFGPPSPVQVNAEKEANVERSKMIQQLMNYAIKRWANRNKGIFSEGDKHIWEWCTLGTSYLKTDWQTVYTRFVDIEQERVMIPGPVDAQGNTQMVEDVVERPVKKDEKVFDGPCVKQIPEEDLLVVGGDGDPDCADLIIENQFWTAHQLWTGVDRGELNRDAVEIVIDGGEDYESNDSTAGIKQDKAVNSGENDIDSQTVIDRYQILEAYVKVSLDNSGIESDVVVRVHKETREILSAYYLYSLNKTGSTPYACAEFHRRPGQTGAIGLVELIYSIQEEMDAMHNMKVDFGLLSTMPIGFYRASSPVQKERLPLAPGNLIPLQDPQRDINFPNMGNRSAFAAGEENQLFQIISRITGLGDLNFGVLGAQGAARTATGARAVINESNANLDIFLRRLSMSMQKTYIYLFQMLKQRMPDGMEFRVTGDDGNQYFAKIDSREELAGMFDFEVETVSSNSNDQIKIQRASQTFQVAQNPILLQTGIVSPYNLFDAAKNFLEASGVKDWSRFISQPPGPERIYTPEEIGNRILAGFDFQLDPSQDLQGFVDWATDFINDDVSAGQFDPRAIVNLQSKVVQAQQMLQALEQVRAQTANAAQVQANAGLATDVGAPNPQQIGGGQGA